MNKIAIILAGGSGTRAGGDMPKQLQKLEERPIFMYSVDAFAAAGVTRIVLVINRQWAEEFHEALNNASIDQSELDIRFCPGGASRPESVMNALGDIRLSGWVSEDATAMVAIHDAARPLITSDVISEGYRTASEHLTAVPVVPVTDTLRHLESNGTSVTVPRSEYRAVQTPQIFDWHLLTTAYNQLSTHPELISQVTDDASVIELLDDQSITLYPGSPSNLKITTPIDFAIAAALLK